MKFFKYFPLFMFTILLNFNVYATNTSVSNKVKYSTSSSKGTYKGDEIYLGGYNGQFSINTRYNGRLAMLSFYLNTDDYNFTTNHTYTITLNMATEDWRNNFMGPQVIEANSSGTLGSSLSTSNFRFVSYKQIKFNFKTDGSIPAYLFFRLYSTDYANPNGGNTAITGINNWNLSSIYINDNISSGGGSGGSNPTPTPSPNSNQAIINNQNQNTQNIIENNNQNTTDIIENNNQNTQNIIDNQNELLGNKCSNILDISNVYQNNVDRYQITDGALILNANNTWQNVMYQIPVENGKHYYFSGQFGSEEPNSIIISLSYNGNDPSDLLNNQFFNYGPTELSSIAGGWSTDFVSDRDGYVYLGIWATKGGYSNNAVYYKMMFSDDNKPYCVFGSSSSKIDDTTNAVNRVNDTLNNDSIDDKTGFFSNFHNDDHGLTSIITLPLTTIQSLTNTSCVALSVPIPFTNRNVSLPCMTEVYQQHIPTIFNLWQIVSFGIISYLICIDIFKMVKGFKDPNEDKVEVLDL